jgi:hypothetical protein
MEEVPRGSRPSSGMEERGDATVGGEMEPSAWGRS